MKKLALLLALVLCTWYNASAIDNLDTVWVKRYTHDIVKMKYSPDDKYLLTTNLNSADCIAMPSGEPVAFFLGVCAIEWSKDGKWLVGWVVYGSGNMIVRYETGTWRGMDTIYLPTGDDSHHAMSLAPDNRTLAVSWSFPAKKSFQFYDLVEHKLLKETVYYEHGKTLPIPTVFEAHEMYYTPDSRTIIFHATDWQVRFFDIAADSVVYKYQYGGGGLYLAMSGDGSKIAFSTEKKGIAVEVMDVTTRQITGQINEKVYQLTGIGLSQNGTYLAAAFGFNTTYINVCRTSDMSVVAHSTEASFQTVEFSNNGQFLLTSIGNILVVFHSPPPVSVVENNNGKEVELYPNPVGANIVVGLSLQSEQDVDITIMTLEGAVKKHEVRTCGIVGYNKYILDVSYLSSGIYFVILRAGNTISTVRFIKL